MSIYSKVTNDNGYEYILRDNGNDTFSIIPIDPSNADYQVYLNPEDTLPSNSSDFSQPIGGNE
jgi:hypothetical protein